MACCVPDFEGGEMKKGNKRGTPTPKRATGARKAAPKRTKKPFRLEVGKTYASRDGRCTKIVREAGHSSWPFEGETKHSIRGKITRSYKANGSWLSERVECGGDLIREVPSAKRPVARPRAKGSPQVTPKKSKARK
jgi:hypothetical protein